MNETAREIMLYDARKKSAGVAFLWWFLLGFLGAHRFYVNRVGSAVAQAIANVGGTWLVILDSGGNTAGWVLGVLGGLWVLVDLFLIPGMVRAYNTMLAERLSAAS
ncbi:TM2 domain-containing protein [Ralstonia pseudosolanacearum]|uniref:TM2 domain-containing protein n=1 Tax=Ralstonia pseudosolanacearum TaxID=1310165 RepID=UPI003D08A1D6